MIRRLHSLVVPRCSGFARAVSRAPSVAKLWPWIVVGTVRTRTIRPGARGKIEVHLGRSPNESVLLNLQSQEEIDVFGEVLIDCNYPLEKVPFRPAMIVDCGANIGFFSALALVCFPRTRIIAWEPDTANFKRAREQRILCSDSVVLHAAAVSDREGFVCLEGSGHGCTVRKLSSGKVPCIDFPAWWLANAVPRTLVKMDIEGHEEIVLRAMKGLWMAPMALFLETHALAGDDGELLDLLRADHFDVELLRQHSLADDPRVFKEYFAVLQ